MTRTRTILAALAAGGLAALVAGGPAQAQQKLRIADSFPKGHFIPRLLLEPWMTEVTKRTNGAVTFEHFPAQQLGKATDLLALTQAGAVDIGYIGPSYVSDKMPLSEVAQLPGAFKTACEGTMAYWSLARNGILEKEEYKPNRIRILLAIVLPQYQILTASRVVKTVADAKGLKLRSTGGAQDLTLRSVGAVPVRMAAPDAYESLSRGTLDGLLFPLESVVSYGMDKLVKQSTVGVGFGSFVATYSIGEALWNRLSPETRDAMSKAGEEIVPKFCAEVQKADGEYAEKLKAAGVTFNEIPEAERKQYETAMSGVATSWAEDLEKRRKKGKEVLSEFGAALKKGAATSN